MTNQVKVKKTETHYDSQGAHQVCRGKLVLVKVEDPKDSLLFITSEISGSKIWLTEGCGIRTTGTYYAPVIISEEEDIHPDDFVLCAGDTKIVEITHYMQPEVASGDKILALPNQFSIKHLRAITDGKLKNKNEVFVECEKDTDYSNSTYEWIISCEEYIKLFPAPKNAIGDINPTVPEYTGIWEKIVESFPEKTIKPSEIGIAMECFKAGLEYNQEFESWDDIQKKYAEDSKKYISPMTVENLFFWLNHHYNITPKKK